MWWWTRLALARSEAISMGELIVERPTTGALGVRWGYTGDDDGDAEVDIRYREPGGAWRNGLDLHRVRPENVGGLDVEPAFAGSIFGLLPDTPYDLELTAVDPDGSFSRTVVSATTRAVPTDPPSPREVHVDGTAALREALAFAQPGDVLLLADGVYDGPFRITADGRAAQPIVLRGESRDGAILDGGSCDSGGDYEPCDALEVWGSFVHVEQLTLRAAERGLGFRLPGAIGNVARNLLVHDVERGIGSADHQLDFTLCDNELLGGLSWPPPGDGSASFNALDGITVDGEGHVVCHNRVVGFADGVTLAGGDARAIDIIGNDIEDGWDDGVDLDEGIGNLRVLHNRVTNTTTGFSFEPVHGGPAYVFRNFVVNVVDQQLKFDGETPDSDTLEETSGLYVAHNTFLGAGPALRLDADTTAHQFEIRGNLFVGGEGSDLTLDWSGGIDAGVFDGNGWWPDGTFRWSTVGEWPSFAALAASGVYEENGVLLDRPPLASGVVPPASWTEHLAPGSPALDPASTAVDAALFLPNVTDGFLGAAPDLGAQELGCPDYPYGPRPPGSDAELRPSCDPGGTVGGADSDGDGALDAAEGASAVWDAGGGEAGIAPDPRYGCGCDGSGPSGSVGWLPIALLASWRRRFGRR